MATKRNSKEIERDFRRIRKFAETATSIKDIERATNLSYMEIKTTLSKHPTICKQIKRQLAANKENTIIEKEKNVKDFVIDASITGVEDLREKLSKICSTKAKIILTSVTIRELNNMQKFNDVDAVDARYIMGLAAEKPENFECVLIDENFEIPDDCIINYCAENKENITLLTADKDMALRTRMYGVHVEYLKQPLHKDVKSQIKNNSKIKTLFSAKTIGNKLYISEFQTDTRSIAVYTGDTEYNDGMIQLEIGDDVFVATRKKNYITFTHFRMISLNPEDNCELIYSKDIYDYYKDINVPKTSYKLFIENFKKRYNL